jgi:hypothetical protein
MLTTSNKIIKKISFFLISKQNLWKSDAHYF